ncbi:PIN domain-containing protein [Pseudomonas guariconensis]|uniref:PIN domain-containing protein n=1 Tax=Pseudomonas guariconensis TaxID=1288410 RepID=UPI00209B42BB|nr:PIN domain-containing protein [Pseudomonas guariconensis]MCO7633669.1 PIN domain-containing protein [Pseudomonas guariconensis]
MQLLISDANILIDLEEGELLDQLFMLPYQFTVPDILFFDELEIQHGHLLERGLGLGELTSETMRYAAELTSRTAGPSRNDCFALALAKQENCPLLTGDEALRKAARKEAVEVKGTLWVVEELVRSAIITVAQAHGAYERMRANARRLPWEMAHQRLDERFQ